MIGQRVVLEGIVAEQVHLGGDLQNLRIVLTDGRSVWLTSDLVRVVPQTKPRRFETKGGGNG